MTVCAGVEIARRGDLLDERLDVGAQKLGRAMAHVADEMKVSGMAVGGLESRTAFAEIDLAGDSGVDHPLQRAVDRGATDARIFPADEIAQVVRAQMTLLAQKDVEDAVALAGTLAAGRAEAGEIQGRRYSTRERRAAAAGRRGVRVLDREAAAGDGVDEVDLGAVQIADADRIDEQLHAVRLVHLVARALAVLLDHQAVLEARAAAALHEHAQAAAGLVLFGQEAR